MKKIILILIVIFLTKGCGIGGFWMEGNPYIDEDKPYGSYWLREGVNEETRLDDIAACGSARTEHIGFSDKKIEAEKLPQDSNDIAAYLRLRAAWGRCMESKGYRYEK